MNIRLREPDTNAQTLFRRLQQAKAELLANPAFPQFETIDIVHFEDGDLTYESLENLGLVVIGKGDNVEISLK